jgi:putative addiction module component (TIGR02574 family)
MTHISVADILALPVQERIQLVELIWESVAAFPEAVEITPELESDLTARLADFEQNPEAGYAWDDVKEKLKGGTWRTA